jgi:hypothetical protein
MKVNKQFASLDASTFMVNTLSNYLKGQDTGDILPLPETIMRDAGIPVLKAVSELPDDIVSEILRIGGMTEGLDPNEVSMVDAQAIAAEVLEDYPKRQYPAIAVGSASGAVTLLCAALGIPWLPQAFLVLVKREMPPDELTRDPVFGREMANIMLESNPEIACYQMCDPANDRYMSQKMAYFRVKHTALPRAYADFIRERLAPGGTLISVECEREWPATVTGERHSYQVGGVGGTTIDEYLHGSERVRAFLADEDTPHTRFIVPEPTETIREAEWGFDERLLESMNTLAQEEGYTLKRMQYATEESLSPFVADLYRVWYRENGLPTGTVHFKMYTPFDIVHSIKGGVVPFWLVFNGENSLRTAEAYLAKRDYDRVMLTLFSNYVPAPGIPPAEEWAKRLGAELVATRAEKFPFDAASPVAYLYDLKEKLPEAYAIPDAFPLEDFKALSEGDPHLTLR